MLMPADDSSYEAFITTIRPISMDLTSCSADLDRELYWKLRENKPRKSHRQMFTRYRVNRVASNYFDVDGAFRIEITEPDTSERVLRIECSFLSHLHAEKPVNQEFAERFADSEFRIVIWPYFRQFVTDTTARMGIPPIVIPVSIGRGMETPLLPGSSTKKRELRARPPRPRRLPRDR